jgi:hypothetical protein
MKRALWSWLLIFGFVWAQGAFAFSDRQAPVQLCSVKCSDCPCCVERGAAHSLPLAAVPVASVVVPEWQWSPDGALVMAAPDDREIRSPLRDDLHSSSSASVPLFQRDCSFLI